VKINFFFFHFIIRLYQISKMKFFLNIILFYLIIFNINSLNTNHLCKRKIQSLNKQNIEKKVENMQQQLLHQKQ